MLNRRTHFHVSFILILVVAAGLRLYRLGHESLWFDEIGQIQVASSADLPSFFRGVRQHRGAVPLDYLLFRFTIIPTGLSSEAVYRLPAALFGILSVVVLMRLGTAIGGQAVGLASAIPFSVSVFHITYSQEARFYSLAILLSLVSTSAFVKSLQARSRPSWKILTLVNVAGVYTHYFFVFVMASQALYLAIVSVVRKSNGETRHGQLRKVLVPFIRSNLIVILFFLPWLLWAGLEEPGTIVIPQTHTMAEIWQKLAPTELSRIWWQIALLLAIVGAFRSDYGLLTLVLVLTAAFGPLWIVTESGYFFHFRQLLLALPFLYVSAVMGGLKLGSILDRGFQRLAGRLRLSCQRTNQGTAVLILVTVLFLSFPNILVMGDYYRVYQKEDWRGLVNQLSEKTLPGDEIAVLTFADHRALSFYQDLLDWDKGTQAKLVTERTELERMHANEQDLWMILTPKRTPEVRAEILEWMSIAGLKRSFLHGFWIYHKDEL